MRRDRLIHKAAARQLENSRLRPPDHQGASYNKASLFPVCNPIAGNLLPTLLQHCAAKTLSFVRLSPSPLRLEADKIQPLPVVLKQRDQTE
jgi:hypothetical protein